MIVECGFISNEVEEQKLLAPSYQLKLAKAIADGTQEYFKKYGGESGQGAAGENENKGA